MIGSKSSGARCKRCEVFSHLSALVPGAPLNTAVVPGLEARAPLGASS